MSACDVAEIVHVPYEQDSDEWMEALGDMLLLVALMWSEQVGSQWMMC